MYAIVEILGQQFKAEVDKKLCIHRMSKAQIGDKVEFDKVLLLDNAVAVSIGMPHISGSKVVAEVISHVRGDKVLVFKKKRRKGYRKLNGHRQNFTNIIVKEIIG
ncbi:MAG: 50S ribosomal protein L21 [Bacteroidales bacterium]|jgi:large subunit ribosomal protein L21|nr:50S ribosomal protein L21 [Bacteroidales bacterium]